MCGHSRPAGHIDEIAKHVGTDCHAVVLMDNADWHRTGRLKWPPNTAENVWQYMRQYLSNLVFATSTDIVDAACTAWNALLAETGRVTSIATRTWVEVSQ